jgi:hypothetical protein
MESDQTGFAGKDRMRVSILSPTQLINSNHTRKYVLVYFSAGHLSLVALFYSAVAYTN